MRVLGRPAWLLRPIFSPRALDSTSCAGADRPVDAAIAANAVLAVVTPYMCGIGGDLFAQVYSDSTRALVGLNGSGRAPAEATPDRVRELAGANAIPAAGRSP